MIPRATVPASTQQIIHSAGDYAEGAIDIFAPPGSVVLAPGPGRIVDATPSPAVPGSYQIRGYIRRPDGMEVPFVAAHFTSESHLARGATFGKGDVLGHILKWGAHPRSTHVHWSFRRAGETRLPPPGNVKVVRAFQRFGPML